MISRLRKSSCFANDKGFTLIEMAVVLIIIGLIVGGVVKGKDIISSAKQKKLYSKFLQSWQISYNIYYDRTGWILGDLDNADNKSNANSRDGRCSDPSCDNLLSQLEAIGLEVPVEGSTGSSCERNYSDSENKNYTLTVKFKYNTDIGNYIEVGSTSGFPAELGIAWDTIIDGQRGGDTGDFVYAANGASPSAFSTWPSAADTLPASSVAILKLTF